MIERERERERERYKKLIYTSQSNLVQNRLDPKASHRWLEKLQLVCSSHHKRYCQKQDSSKAIYSALLISAVERGKHGIYDWRCKQLSASPKNWFFVWHIVEEHSSVTNKSQMIELSSSAKQSYTESISRPANQQSSKNRRRMSSKPTDETWLTQQSDWILISSQF